MINTPENQTDFNTSAPKVGSAPSLEIQAVFSKVMDTRSNLHTQSADAKVGMDFTNE